MGIPAISILRKPRKVNNVGHLCPSLEYGSDIRLPQGQGWGNKSFIMILWTTYTLPFIFGRIDSFQADGASFIRLEHVQLLVDILAKVTGVFHRFVEKPTMWSRGKIWHVKGTRIHCSRSPFNIPRHAGVLYFTYYVTFWEYHMLWRLHSPQNKKEHRLLFSRIMAGDKNIYSCLSCLSQTSMHPTSTVPRYTLRHLVYPPPLLRGRWGL